MSRLHTTAASTSRLTPDAALFSLSPEDGHNDAPKHVELKVNKHLYLCHPLVLSSPMYSAFFHQPLWPSFDGIYVFYFVFLAFLLFIQSLHLSYGLANGETNRFYNTSCKSVVIHSVSQRIHILFR